MRTNARLKVPGYASREPRVAVQCDAMLTESDGCELAVVIMDVSRDGFRLHSREKLEPDSEVLLTVAKLAPVKALIRWTRGFEAGGIFLEPMSL